MIRLTTLLVALAVVGTSCSGGGTAEAAAARDQAVADVYQAAVAEIPDDPTPEPAADDAVGVAQNDLEPEVGDQTVTLLLPDPERWVVVQDWTADQGSAAEWPDQTNVLQLDFAPVDDNGVAQLGRRISVNYQLADGETFDQQWGDTSSMGAPTDFETEVGRARTVSNDEFGFAAGQLWSNGTLVYAQAMDAEAGLDQFITSLAQVDEAIWLAARAGAADQQLAAVDAVMQDIEIVEVSDEPLPHWIFPEPWQVEWVTDTTIWTAEQHAQRAALAQANQPAALAAQPEFDDYRLWRFGFAEDPAQAGQQFVPQLLISVSLSDAISEILFPVNYPTIEALGLEGVISESGGSNQVRVDLGGAEVRVGATAINLSIDQVRAFFNAAEFTTGDPRDGLAIADPRFQSVELAEWDEQSPSWHAVWKHANDGSEGAISVWRLTVPELRNWLFTRGDGLEVPADVWQVIAAGGLVDFGNQFGSHVTYDASQGLLMSLRGIEVGELIAMDRDDWITFAEPVNADPLRPR